MQQNITWPVINARSSWRAKTYWMNWQRAERNVRSKNILMSVSSKNLITLSGQKVSQCQLSIVQPDWPQWLWIWTLQLLKLYCGRGKICPPRAMNAVLFALDCKCWNWLCWTRTPLSGLLVLMEVALSTILLISSGETSSNRDIFFTDDAAKKIFPTSKISAQEIRHQFFLIWSNLTIMAHMMGLENQSESWKIIILS